MAEPDDRNTDLAANYALGLLRGAERDALSSRLETDEALRSSVEYWQNVFAAIDERRADDASEPPTGLFEKILDRIDAEGLHLPGTRTRRGDEAKWREISPGIHRRVLNVDRNTNRLSILVRMDPGSTYRSHGHDTAEEMLLLEGELWLGDLKLSTGDHHLALANTQHPVGRTVCGCLVHITRSLSDS